MGFHEHWITPVLMGATSIGLVALSTEKGTTMSSNENTTTATPTVEDVEAIVFPTLAMEVSGRSTTLLPTQYKVEDPADYDPNARYWSLREPTHSSGSWGVTVNPLADELPTFVVIDGVRVSLEKGTTKGTYTDRKTKQQVTKPERPLVAFNGLQVLPTFGRVVTVIVTISVTEHKQWWIKTIVSIPESPEEKAIRLQRQAEKKAAKNTSALFG